MGQRQKIFCIKRKALQNRERGGKSREHFQELKPFFRKNMLRESLGKRLGAINSDFINTSLIFCPLGRSNKREGGETLVISKESTSFGICPLYPLENFLN